jgi:hypothetical protein
MELAEPSVYNCPSCKEPLLKINYTSYPTKKTDGWSDEWFLGYSRFDPHLAKCSYCAEVFFLSRVIEHKDIPEQERKDYKYLADPDLADFLNVLRKGSANSEYDISETRYCIRRILNDKVRNGETFNDDEMKIWQDNCEKLLSIKEQKREEKRERLKQKKDPMFMLFVLTEITDLCIEIAELKRNLGRFDECLKELENFPNSYDWLKEQFAQKCKAKDPMVFKIKDTNPASENRPPILIEKQYQILMNKDDELLFCIRERDGEPLEPEVLYSGGRNALLHRRPGQFILLGEINKDAREALSKAENILIDEFDLKYMEQMNDPDFDGFKSLFKNEPECIKREYKVKVSHVSETLDSVESIINDGHLLLTVPGVRENKEQGVMSNDAR